MVFEALNESGCLVVGFLDHGENFSEMLKKMKWEETAKHQGNISGKIWNEFASSIAHSEISRYKG